MTPTKTPVTLDPANAKVVTDWAHTSNLLCCRADPTGKYVVAGAIDHTIQRWEIATAKKTALVGHTNWVRTLGFAPDGKTLYSGAYDGRLLSWDMTTASPKPVRDVPAHHGWVRGLAVSQDGQRIATCGNDNLVKIWSAQDGKLVRELSGHPCNVYCVHFVPGSHECVSGDVMGNIYHWKTDDSKPTRTFDVKEIFFHIGDLAPFGGIINLTFSPDGSTLTTCGLHKSSNALAGNRRPVVVSFDWKTGAKRPKQESLKKELDGTVWRAIYHPTGTLIGVFEKQVGFWNPGTPDVSHLAATPSEIFDCDLHPNQLTLFTAHHDGHLRSLSIGRS